MFSNFWRTYDLAFHFLFGLHLILHLYLQAIIQSGNYCAIRKDNTHKATVYPKSNSTLSNDIDQNCSVIETKISVSGVIFAIGKIVSDNLICQYAEYNNTYRISIILDLILIFRFNNGISSFVVLVSA